MSDISIFGPDEVRAEKKLREILSSGDAMEQQLRELLFSLLEKTKQGKGMKEIEDILKRITALKDCLQKVRFETDLAFILWVKGKAEENDDAQRH